MYTQLPCYIFFFYVFYTLFFPLKALMPEELMMKHSYNKKEKPVNTDGKQMAIVKMWGKFWNYELKF